MISLIIPAHNEEEYIANCLDAVLASDVDTPVEIIVAANACTDQTVRVASDFMDQAKARGWRLMVLNTQTPGKLNALNLAEAETQGDVLIYLDADVVISAGLIGALAAALYEKGPRYASGVPEVTAQSGFARAYARIWAKLPFVTYGVPGFGVFAVNRAGRARWSTFPDIISDDTFVRLHFTSQERIRVAAVYRWPMIEGFANLVRVRRRQDRGVAEIAQRFPELLQNEDVTRPALGQVASLGLRDPVGFAAYVLVKLAVKTPYARAQGWARGR